MPTLRVADWIMGRLADLGVDHVFLLPGGGAMYLDDGLACEPRLTAVPCHHEQAAAIAAEACGRTGAAGNAGFGVCVVTTGPGSLTATGYAPTVRLPRVVVPGARSLVLTGFAPTVTVGGSTPTPERVDTGFWGVVDQAASWGVVNDSGGWDVVDETARWKP